MVTFSINLWSIKKKYYLWFSKLRVVTIATSLSESTRDFLKLLFHMFPYNEILKIFKIKFETNTAKYLCILNFSQISEVVYELRDLEI